MLSGLLEKDRRTAWQLASTMMVWLTVLLAGLVLVGEAILAGIWLLAGHSPGIDLLVGLSATLLPYMLLICLAAQVTATLQALGQFTVPALTPTVLNLCWLTGVWVIAPLLGPQTPGAGLRRGRQHPRGRGAPVGRATAGVYRFGFRFQYDWAASRAAMIQIGRTLTPMLFSLAVTQINTFTDSMIAWGLAAAPERPATDRLAGRGPRLSAPPRGGRGHFLRRADVPVSPGDRGHGRSGLDLSALEPARCPRAARPSGGRPLAGSAAGVVSERAGRRGTDRAAQPIARLLQNGAFTPEDTARAAHMIAAYALGVWAYCASPVMVRGFYALGDCATPVRVAAMVVALNLALNLTLIWTPLREAGLGVLTAISSAVEVLVLSAIFARSRAPLQGRSLAATIARTLVATLLMALAAAAALHWISPTPGLFNAILRLAVPTTLGVVVYCGVYRLSGGKELGMLLKG